MDEAYHFLQPLCCCAHEWLQNLRLFFSNGIGSLQYPHSTGLLLYTSLATLYRSVFFANIAGRAASAPLTWLFIYFLERGTVVKTVCFGWKPNA